MLSKDEILNTLPYFTGTESYTKHFPFRLLLTDGAKWMAENAECYWVFDIVGSILSKKNIRVQDFLHVTFKRTPNNPKNIAIVTVDDGNENVLYTQKLEYTDFPLDEFSFYVGKQDNYWVALLKSEY